MIPTDAIKSVHVDWLSYTILDAPETLNFEKAASHSERFFVSAFGEAYEKFFFLARWEPSGSHRPYTRASRSEDGIALYYGNVPHQKIELQAKACKKLASDGVLMSIASRVSGHIKRLDVAIDIDGKATGLTPEKIAAMAMSKRIRSRSSQVTDSGSTFWCGSRDSDRFMKVYEYNAPHDRAGVPRIEFTLRNSQAEIFVNWWMQLGLHEATQAVINVFQIEGLEIADMNEKLPTEHVERSHQKTLMWLIKQCAPAYRKLVQSGVIENQEEFLMKHFWYEGERQQTMFSVIEGEGND